MWFWPAALVIVILIVIAMQPKSSRKSNTTTSPSRSWPPTPELFQGTDPVYAIEDFGAHSVLDIGNADLTNSQIRWSNHKILNFRTNDHILKGGYGFVAVSIRNIPSFSSRDPIENIIRLKSSLPEDLLEINLFEFDSAHYQLPMLSIHSNGSKNVTTCGKYQKFGGSGRSCGLFLNGSIRGKRDDNLILGNYQKNDRTLSRLGTGTRWIQRFNNYNRRRNTPVSFVSKIYREDDRDCVLVGYSLSNWIPTHPPSISEVTENCDFLIRTTDVRICEKGYLLLVLSDTRALPSTGEDQAYWDLPDMVHYDGE